MSNVVNLGEFRFSKTDTNSYGLKTGDCQHKHLTMNAHGETVTCDDCKMQVSAYWALGYFVSNWDRWTRELARQRDELHELAGKQVTLKAALDVERAWRSRTMAPTCPHCHAAILPTDGFGRFRTNKEMEVARRKARASREGGQ